VQADKKRLEAAAANIAARAAAANSAEAALAERRQVMEDAEAALASRQQEADTGGQEAAPAGAGTAASGAAAEGAAAEGAAAGGAAQQTPGVVGGGNSAAKAADTCLTPYEDADAGDQVCVGPLARC